MSVVHGIINHLLNVSAELGNIVFKEGGLPGLTAEEQNDVKWELMRLREQIADTTASLAEVILHKDIHLVQHEIHNSNRHNGAASRLEE